jgi:hypothetical protein
VNERGGGAEVTESESGSERSEYSQNPSPSQSHTGSTNDAERGSEGGSEGEGLLPGPPPLRLPPPRVPSMGAAAEWEARKTAEVTERSLNYLMFLECAPNVP